jgi:hypothetical protein
MSKTKNVSPEILKYFDTIGIDLKHSIIIGKVTPEMVRPEIKEELSKGSFDRNITGYPSFDFALSSINAFGVYIVITPEADVYMVGETISQKISDIEEMCALLFNQQRNDDHPLMAKAVQLMNGFFEHNRIRNVFGLLSPFSDDVDNFITTSIDRHDGGFFNFFIPQLQLRVGLKFHEYVVKNAQVYMRVDKNGRSDVVVETDCNSKIINRSKILQITYGLINDVVHGTGKISDAISRELGYRMYSTLDELISDANIEFIPCSDPVIHGSKQELLYKKVIESYWKGV